MLTVDCAFPAGNIIVEKIEGDTVFIRQDIRDTSEDWFYWCFRVSGAAGRTLTFRFTGSDVFAARGPAASRDHGVTWAWLGRECVEGKSFRYTFPADAAEVRFSLAMPYTEANLKRFLARHAGDPDLRVERFCVTSKGRAAELLRAGRLDGSAPCKLLFTCRHHCCEMMASYELEGILDAVLADDDQGAFFREKTEFLAVPFVDKDGVEDGDQGKFRKPHDHCCDYGGESIYATTRALRQLVPAWSAGKLRVAMDLHCPWIRGQHNEDIYFVGDRNPVNWARAERLSQVLERTRRGPLPYSTRNNLPFGQAWNTGSKFITFGRWTDTLPALYVHTAIELPYANASGAEVNQESAYAFGSDLASALRVFLEQEGLV